MSYAGPTSRTSRQPHIEPATGASPHLKSSADRPQEWPTPRSRSQARQTAVFAAGIVVGLAVGAGVALLFAPESGAYTRRALVRRGRRVTKRGRDAWDDLRDELRAAVRNRKRAWHRRRAARQDAAAIE